MAITGVNRLVAVRLQASDSQAAEVPGMAATLSLLAKTGR
jgi:hypothetical protein